MEFFLFKNFMDFIVKEVKIVIDFIIFIEFVKKFEFVYIELSKL